MRDVIGQRLFKPRRALEAPEIDCEKGRGPAVPVQLSEQLCHQDVGPGPPVKLVYDMYDGCH